MNVDNAARCAQLSNSDSDPSRAVSHSRRLNVTRLRRVEEFRGVPRGAAECCGVDLACSPPLMNFQIFSKKF